MQDRILRRYAVREATGLPNTTIDRLEKEGRFPKRRPITDRNVGWSESEIQQWIDAAKDGDPNIRRWYQKYGDKSPTELDALHPEKLKQLVKNSLSHVYDMSEIEEQKSQEAREDALLNNMRGNVIAYLNDSYPQIMKEAGYL